MILDEFLKLNGIVSQLLGVGLFGIVTFAARQFWKMYKELTKRNDQLDELLHGQIEMDSRLDMIEQQGSLRQNANLASLHDRIYAHYEIVLDRGWVSTKELGNIVHLWEAYEALGGNGTGKQMYKRICALPIKNEEDEKQ